MQANAGITESELITGQMKAAEKSPEASSQSLFIQDIFHIHLEEGKGLVLIPGPMSRIERPTALIEQAISIKDMAGGVMGDVDTLMLEPEGGAFWGHSQPFSELLSPFFRFLVEC